MDLVSINLRGTVFLVLKSNLSKAPANSRLLTLNKKSCYYMTERQEFYFDRNPAIFQDILDYLSTGDLHLPSNLCATSARKELHFWGIPLSGLHQCCWKTLYQIDSDMCVLKRLTKSCGINQGLSTKSCDLTTTCTTWKCKIWKFMDDIPVSAYAKVCILLQML